MICRWRFWPLLISFPVRRRIGRFKATLIRKGIAISLNIKVIQVGSPSALLFFERFLTRYWCHLVWRFASQILVVYSKAQYIYPRYSCVKRHVIALTNSARDKGLLGNWRLTESAENIIHCATIRVGVCIHSVIRSSCLPLANCSQF